MKLYAEEQVNRAIDLSAKGIDLVLCDDVLSYVKHIELPSDEEVDKGNREFLENVNTIVHRDLERDGYLEIGFWKGAKWVIEHIKQQGK